MRPAERVLRLWRQGEPVWMIQRLTGMGEAYVSRIIRDYEKAAGAAETSLTPHLK